MYLYNNYNLFPLNLSKKSRESTHTHTFSFLSLPFKLPLYYKLCSVLKQQANNLIMKKKKHSDFFIFSLTFGENKLQKQQNMAQGEKVTPSYLPQKSQDAFTHPCLF